VCKRQSSERRRLSEGARRPSGYPGESLRRVAHVILRGSRSKGSVPGLDATGRVLVGKLEMDVEVECAKMGDT
jgi:hypothetical protein